MQHGRLIHARFEAQAGRTPDALAISSDHGDISYGALDRLARDLAARVDRDCPPGGVVAILAERGPRAVVAALACSLAGRPFVILDLAYPVLRLRQMIEICRPGMMLEAGQAPAEFLDQAGLPVAPVGLDAPAGPPPALPAHLSPDDPAYLLFTSGSTGTPKCVAVSHRPLVNFVDWQARTFGLTARDRFTLLSGLSHDPILRDIFTPLSVGASIVIPAQAELTAPGALAAWFARARPTVAHMTPPLGRLLTSAADPAASFDDLRYVFWGGDVLRRPMVEALAAIAPGCESVNFYGATETPQAASFFRVRPAADDDRVPIGQGIDGFEIEVRSEAGGAAAVGEPGDIVVRSAFLPLGHVANGELPRGRVPTEGAYATGDAGYRRADGQVVIQGRRDDQLKVRGYRVEMGEITACALKFPQVELAVTLNLGSAEAVRLCCFVQSGPAGVETGALRDHLAARLPEYMRPEAIVALPLLPLLPNGKIDRQALIARERDRRAAAQPRGNAASTPMEARLVADWRDIFGHEEIEPASSFAALGGDSLSYVSAYLSLDRALGNVPDHWTTLTIAQLAACATPNGKPSRFVAIDSAILMRAVAISAVVASHFQLIFTGGSATSALLWVSGFIFGGLQLREVEHQSDARPIVRLLKSLLIPLFAYEIAIGLAKLAMGGAVSLSSLLLYTDLIDYTGLPGDGPNAYGGADYLMWYIHCIFHIVLIYGALILAAKHLFKAARPGRAAAVAAVVIGLAGRFALPLLLAPDFWARATTTGFWLAKIDPMSFFNHAPTTHLATFALAALSGFVGGRWRVATLAVACAYVLASGPIYGISDCLAIAPVAAVLLFAPKVPAPRWMSMPIYLVAGASFFIYLLHFKVLALYSRLTDGPVILAWAGAIVFGVAAWSAWNWGTSRIGAILAALRRRRAPRPQPVGA